EEVVQAGRAVGLFLVRLRHRSGADPAGEPGARVRLRVDGARRLLQPRRDADSTPPRFQQRVGAHLGATMAGKAGRAQVRSYKIVLGQSQPGSFDRFSPATSNVAVRVPPALTGNSTDTCVASSSIRHRPCSSLMNMAVASSVSGRSADIDFGSASSTATLTRQPP